MAVENIQTEVLMSLRPPQVNANLYCFDAVHFQARVWPEV